MNLNEMAAKVADNADEPVATVKKVIRQFLLELAKSTPSEVVKIVSRYVRV